MTAKVLLCRGGVTGLDPGDKKLNWDIGCMYSGGKSLTTGSVAVGKAFLCPNISGCLLLFKCLFGLWCESALDLFIIQK